jgi:hypothetical protein
MNRVEPTSKISSLIKFVREANFEKSRSVAVNQHSCAAAPERVRSENAVNFARKIHAQIEIYRYTTNRLFLAIKV